MTLRFLSLFSGIEAASVAWRPLGWEAVAFAEIEPFPSAVLAHHYPDVPNLGDVSQITDAQIAALGPIDIVAGGSPCQDLSVAGKRAGLGGARSGLFHEQIRIFHAARHFCGARYLVWENVPGAFSSNGGRDFAEVVGAMAGCRLNAPADGWATEGVALGEHGLVEWAVLDAQWFGVAQRRRRVFAVLDTGDWAGRPPILLERDSLRGDSPPGREAGEAVTGTLGARATAGGGLGTDFDLGGGLIASNAEGATGLPFLTASNLGKTVNNQTPLIAHTLRGDGFDASETGKGDAAPCVAISFQERGRSDGRSLEIGGDTAYALTAPNGGSRSQERNVLTPDACVRRLTPVECERLQGFSDDYTRIPWRGKPAEDCPDGPRYRALGNSWAVPVARWVGERIAAVDSIRATERRAA